MSGHSKWSTIKRQKGVTDKKRSALFSKLTKAIHVAIKEGGNDPEGNLKLRLAITKAKQANLPKENIKRAIRRDDAAKNREEIIYEAFGPGGSAFIIEAATDNKNRLLGEIKSILNKHLGKLAQPNSVSRLFASLGVITIPVNNLTKEKKEEMMLRLMDLGADDVTETTDNIKALFSRNAFDQAIERLNKEQIDFNIERGLKAQLPLIIVNDTKKTIDRLISLLKELDDVENIYTNVI